MNSKNIRVKTITCHDVYNHGASLQAYALQHYLLGKGFANEIIDYKPLYLSGHYRLGAVCNPVWDTNFISRWIYLGLKLPGRLLALKRKRAFDEFTKTYLKLTAERFGSNEELKKNCPEADVYIAGSDQIWNTTFQNGRDAAFYLDFVPAGKLRLSYAASFATNNISAGYESFVKEKIGAISAISVRESDGLQLLKSLGIEGGTHVCDPVFLLEKQEWEKLATDSFNENYILCYDFGNNRVIRQIALTVAKITGWKIYTISNTLTFYADRSFIYSGPKTFLSLIKNAKLVISNSFHGTAFSIIFERNFFVVKRTDGLNLRMIDFLDHLELTDRLIGADVKTTLLLKQIHFPSVKKLMNPFIANSKQFLNQNLPIK